MKQHIFFTFLFLLIANIIFAQSEPLLVVEESKKGYNVFLEMEDVSNVFQVHLESVSHENNTTVVENIDIEDIVKNKAIKNLGFKNSQTELTVTITDLVGNRIIYPTIEININDLFLSSNN